MSVEEIVLPFILTLSTSRVDKVPTEVISLKFPVDKLLSLKIYSDTWGYLRTLAIEAMTIGKSHGRLI